MGISGDSDMQRDSENTNLREKKNKGAFFLDKNTI